MVFTRTSDKYLARSVKNGWIVGPKQPYVDDAVLFLYDDVSGLGMACPTGLVEALGRCNAPMVVLDAEDLAQCLVGVLPVQDRIAVVDGGGILAYLFLKKAGYQGSIDGIVKMERSYLRGVPSCERKGTVPFTPTMIIDDIIASGQTFATAAEGILGSLDAACLLASANVPKGNDGARYRDRSSVRAAGRLYCPKFVNGLGAEEGNRKPAILSLRYLLTKAVDNNDYTQEYLKKKFRGEAAQIVELVREVKRDPIDLLRRDSLAFLAEYGVR